MVQIILGVLALLGALSILMGAGDTLRLPVGDLFPLLGFGGTALIVASGLLLVAQGLYSRAVRRSRPDRHGFRSRGLAAVSLAGALLLGIAVPLLAELLDLVRIGGFPLGYYMAAQGAIIGLVILAFLASARQDRIDLEDGSDE